MNKADRIFRLGARTFFYSVAVIFIALILRGVLGSAIEAQRLGLVGISGLTLQIVGLIAAVVFLGSSIILWIEGWFFIISGWRWRPIYFNILLIIFLFFGSILAALVLHFVRATSTKSSDAGS